MNEMSESPQETAREEPSGHYRRFNKRLEGNPAGITVDSTNGPRGTQRALQ